MPDDFLGTQSTDTQKGLDYLGKNVPVSVQGQPTLPTGGPAGGGQTGTIGGGGVAGPLTPNPRQKEQIQQFLQERGLTEGGASTGPGAGEAGVGLGAITGTDPTAAKAGISALSSPFAGLPGIISAINATGKLGLNALDTDLSINTSQGKQAIAPSGKLTSGNQMVDFVLGMLGIPIGAHNQFVALDPEMQAQFNPQNTQQLQSLLQDPIALEFLIDHVLTTQQLTQNEANMNSNVGTYSGFAPGTALSQAAVPEGTRGEQITVDQSTGKISLAGPRATDTGPVGAAPTGGVAGTGASPGPSGATGGEGEGGATGGPGGGDSGD